MWPFSRKIPASHGLVGVTLATCLTAFKLYGPNTDGVRLSALCTAYFRDQADHFDVPTSVSDRFMEYVWAGIIAEHPIVANTFPAFAIWTLQAGKTLGQHGKVKGTEKFFRDIKNSPAGQNVPWSVAKKQFLDEAVNLLTAGEHMIIERQPRWQLSQ